MTGEEIIKQIQDEASEWLEMSEDPGMFIAGVLANKIITLTEYIKFLEKMAGYNVGKR